MHATRSHRKTSPFRALAWTVLALLAASCLRVVVICSGPCCEAHVQIAFAERSCCAERAGGCCAAKKASSRASESASEERRSCCVPTSCCEEEQEHEREPGAGEQLERAGSCCTSSPVDLAYGPLPLPPSWWGASELAELTMVPPACAARVPAMGYASPRATLADRLVDPPPLQNLRAIVSTTLLRI
ncbi:MAG: hypothetical protein JNM84_16690 [Planctomycetes bacterium]|nr:hypothetical protein [Planctomycetota bacterium]